MVRQTITRRYLTTYRRRTPLSKRFAGKAPTLMVWGVSLFSKAVRHYAANEGKWQAGWIQFMTVGFPMVLQFVGTLF